MLDVAITRPNYDSPLRYPGGKSSMANFLSGAIRASGIAHPTYVEPFAGGAGAAISLLLQGQVERVVINDLDPAVHAFWSAVVSRGDEFVERIKTVPLTLDEWRTHKAVYAGRASQADDFELGFSFFFLNRTNRSGVMNAGVIGGQKQEGRYKIDARFNRDRLSERVKSVFELRDRIEVSSVDGRSLIEAYSRDDHAFLYVDPPYVQMGGSLYLNSFSEADHALLATCLNRNARSHWVLTYDNVDLIRNLYASRYTTTFDLIYSARNRGRATELLILSDSMRDALIPAVSEGRVSFGSPS